MKRAYIIVVNEIIMVTLLIFVVLYSGYENRSFDAPETGHK